MDLMSTFDIAASALRAESIRLNVVASNLSNAQAVAKTDKEVYHAKQPIFASVQHDLMSTFENGPQAGVKVLGIAESTDPTRREYRPGHPLADEQGYITMTNVNALEEMANMISASRNYRWNVEVVNTTRQLSQKTLQLLQ